MYKLIKKSAIFSVFLSLGIIHSFAQTFNLQKKADDDFANTNFHFALESYLKIYDKKPDDASIVEKIVLCNRSLHNFNDVLTWCDQLIRLEPNNPEYMLQHAIAQHNIGKYVDAKAEYLEYLKVKPTEQKTILSLVRSCDSGLKWSRSPNPRVLVENVKELNTSFSEFGLTRFGTGYMFASDRKSQETKLLTSKGGGKKGEEQEIFGFTGRPYLKLYYVNAKGDSSWEKPSFFAKLMTEKYHTSNASFDEKNNVLYFTRTRKVDVPKSFTKSTFRAELVYSEAFREIKPFPFNSTLNYSVGDPCISSSGKRLYFSSGIPGGQGGQDLYYSDLAEDGTWKTPVNLGAKVNSAGEERYPTLYNDSVLFFSSDGHTGMGGLDLFYSTLQKDGTWGEVTNLGVPFNSAQDDFFLMVTKLQKEDNNSLAIQGYLSSDRIGGMGSDDIYSVKSTDIKKTEPLPPDNSVMAKGKITDQATGDGIPDVKMAVNEVNKPEISNYKTDTVGSFAFPVKKQKKYAVRFKKPKFFTKTDTIAISNKPEALDIKEKLEPMVIDKAVRLDNIYYEFNSWTISPKSAGVLNGLIKLLNDNPEIDVELGSHTDSRGDREINRFISQKRAESVVNYLETGGIAAKRLSAHGYGKDKPVVDCGSGCTEADHALNRRTEFKIVKIAE